MPGSSKSPTEILKSEHIHVLQELDELEKAMGNLGNSKSVSATLKQLGHFFNNDFWTHFAKEENALFPELEKFIPRDAGPVGVMLAEQDDLRKTNRKMQGAISAFLSSPERPEPRGALQRYGSDFTMALRDHIDKEDNILFPMADEHLDHAQMASVAKLFTDIETAAGPNMHGLI